MSIEHLQKLTAKLIAAERQNKVRLTFIQMQGINILEKNIRMILLKQDEALASLDYPVTDTFLQDILAQVQARKEELIERKW